MGKLESEFRLERRKGYVRDGLLLALGLSGAILFPSIALATLQIIGIADRNKRKFSYQIKNVASRLASQGLVRFKNKGFIELTESGQREFHRLELEMVLRSNVRRKWDKRWRMVIFDIPERYRNIRDKLRVTLQSYGFHQLQQSVWIFPYDCEDVVTLLKADLGVAGSVLYAIVEKLENDSRLKQEFGLR
ncbi:MAG: CRISPR-associated endonuclease Cas2 [bacterium]|nr:CRISPR-associated endonuclease Cas2 [bacterium]